MQELAHPTISA